jgi:hypothetical protein
MKLLRLILFTGFFSSALSANALVLTDVHQFNAPLVNGEPAGINFNLVDHGYNHLTDTITTIRLSLDFREIVETEENMENWEDMSTWEPIIFYSWIFDGRSIYADLDTGLVEFALSRTKTYECQYYDYVDGDEICLQNLDLYGEMSSWFVAYTDNLWLGEARLEAEITRIPEPAPLLLFGLGLIGLGLRQGRTQPHKRP